MKKRYLLFVYLIVLITFISNSTALCKDCFDNDGDGVGECSQGCQDGENLDWCNDCTDCIDDVTGENLCCGNGHCDYGIDEDVVGGPNHCPSDCPLPDGEPCSENADCINFCNCGTCSSESAPECCTNDDCDDGLFCTDDSCSVSGTCSHSPKSCGSNMVCDDDLDACKCGSGYTDCSGSCKDLQNDPNNCGSCGNVCPSGSCTRGTCDTVCSPSTEVCDGTDNDCDGSIDEGLTRQTTCGQGECEVTVSQTCSGGSWVPSCSPGSPTSETCDGLDNDCDGQIDETFTNKGQSCTVGVGDCQNTGTYVCKADKTGTVCSATAGTPGTEICTIHTGDEDCDGLADCADLEDCPDGTECASDMWCSAGECISTGPAPEADCTDGVDNDEDGDIDCGDVDCQNKLPCDHCISHPPTESDCSDSIDNDCDGFTDCDDDDCAANPCSVENARQCSGSSIQVCTLLNNCLNWVTTSCSPDSCCSGYCVDVMTHESNCGSCGNACAAEETCCEGTCRDLDTDPFNCGSCGNDCTSYDHVDSASCNSGVCGISCESGHHNIDGSFTNGCEYECTITEAAESSCSDNLDNDCDGFTDCADDDCNPSEECENGVCVRKEEPLVMQNQTQDVRIIIQMPENGRTYKRS